ncbi:hypothetical protein GALL_80190 [mine drainage metagenome]|uniref:MMPL family protein n=1 Tax=mine drainage metagenome TaxID=410659 RepID=A0A1J5SQ51_9ZZZZ
MRRALALLWLLVVTAALAYLGLRLSSGLVLRTDLLALLPHEADDAARRQADDAVTRALSSRLLFLVGDPDRGRARAAAARLGRRLAASGLAEVSSDAWGADRLRRMGALYAPYRQGLLSERDRALLRGGQAQAVARRALSQVFGFVGTTSAALVRADPFLLTSDFFTGLPLPLSRLGLDDGLLTVRDQGLTWVMVSARLLGQPYALDVQRRLDAALDLDSLTRATPGLRVLKLGAVFFAQAGADQAMRETSRIGIASMAGTVLVILLAFRALAPLGLGLLVIGTGVGTALAACLWLFGTLHVGALLFGVSLIGVAVDYALQYCTEIFAAAAPPAARLRRVFAGIGLGAATTIIGYLTLFLAPFPGLHQIAAFSAIGLAAAWLTVVLWLPALDRSRPPRHGRAMLAAAAALLAFWRNAPRRGRALLALLLLAGALGVLRLHADDDVHHLQSLSAPLVAQQQAIQRLTGTGDGSRFFLVEAADDETALEREEALAARLRPLVAAQALAGFQAPAQYVPSAARQRDNRRLVAQALRPLLPAQLAALGLTAPPPPPSGEPPVLTLAEALRPGGPLPFLSLLVLRPGLHVVRLDGVARPALVAAAAQGLEGVRYVDPAGQFSALLGKYRQRALGLLALSALLMAPLLMLRYGPGPGLRRMLPPALAVALTPALLALSGAAFTFFDAMGLVLVLSIGVDYAVFLAESDAARAPVTMLAVLLAACTALLSFGLLALSGVEAVHAFGVTMLLGILLAVLLAPLGGRLRS